MIFEYVTNCVLLHNLLLNTTYDTEWIEQDGVNSDEEDELNAPVFSVGSTQNGTRRKQILAYFGGIPKYEHRIKQQLTNISSKIPVQFPRLCILGPSVFFSALSVHISLAVSRVALSFSAVLHQRLVKQ